MNRDYIMSIILFSILAGCCVAFAIHNEYNRPPFTAMNASVTEADSGKTNVVDQAGTAIVNYSATKPEVKRSYDSPSVKSSSKTNSNNKKAYDSYKDGYEDAYNSRHYDYDRYDRDSDYADGVEKAIEDDYYDYQRYSGKRK